LHTTIQSSSMFVFLTVFTALYAILAASPFGLALAVGNDGGDVGAGDKAFGSTSKTSPTFANGHSTKGSAVIQLPVNTGDPTLDKQINKFYSCVSKTHLDPPSKDQVDGCYFQFLGGHGGNSQSDSGHKASTHTQTQGKPKFDDSPTGMLVEVP
jgi:hypothetical protein